MGTLFLIATPIGNLDDITLRALRVLGEVPVIAAEDTRAVRRILTRHKIRSPKLLSYTERNRRARTKPILVALEDGAVALVSEAGMPGISDPGVHLVEAAITAGHQIVPLPGPSALTAAVAAAGFPSRRFHFLGFLPRGASQRRKLLRQIAPMADTLVAFESPHRLRESLTDMLNALGDRRIAACRELTKIHEEIFRGTIAEALQYFAVPRGEYTLVIEGEAGEGDKPLPDTAPDIDEQLSSLKAQGWRARDAVREVMGRTGRPRQEVYRRWLAL
jgi:16S rRNA (cytidine1402-2'-O)-methyltransferase